MRTATVCGLTHKSMQAMQGREQCQQKRSCTRKPDTSAAFALPDSTNAKKVIKRKGLSAANLWSVYSHWICCTSSSLDCACPWLLWKEAGNVWEICLASPLFSCFRWNWLSLPTSSAHGKSSVCKVQELPVCSTPHRRDSVFFHVSRLCRDSAGHTYWNLKFIMTYLQQAHQCLLRSRNGPSWPRQTSLRNALLNQCKMLVLAMLVPVNPTNGSFAVRFHVAVSLPRQTYHALPTQPLLGARQNSSNGQTTQSMTYLGPWLPLGPWLVVEPSNWRNSNVFWGIHVWYRSHNSSTGTEHTNYSCAYLFGIFMYVWYIWNIYFPNNPKYTMLQCCATHFPKTPTDSTTLRHASWPRAFLIKASPWNQLQQISANLIMMTKRGI